MLVGLAVSHTVVSVPEALTPVALPEDTPELPAGPYDVVLADPPWSYTGQQDKWGAAAKFYRTLDDDQIGSLAFSHMLAKRAVVFCWATCPRLDAAIETLQAWGLHYRGVAFVWIKTKQDGTPIGAQGVRPSVVKPLTELVLVASTVKSGRPLPLGSEAVVQTVFAPRGEHSVKPDIVAERIEALYPNARRLELFARRRRPGWDAWGDEAPEA